MQRTSNGPFDTEKLNYNIVSNFQNAKIMRYSNLCDCWFTVKRGALEMSFLQIDKRIKPPCDCDKSRLTPANIQEKKREGKKRKTKQNILLFAFDMIEWDFWYSWRYLFICNGGLEQFRYCGFFRSGTWLYLRSGSSSENALYWMSDIMCDQF